MRIDWIECIELKPVRGHGVTFFSANDRKLVLASVEEFEWLHGSPESIEVKVRAPGEGMTAEFLSDARKSIEHWLNDPEMRQRHEQPSAEVLPVISG